MPVSALISCGSNINPQDNLRAALSRQVLRMLLDRELITEAVEDRQGAVRLGGCMIRCPNVLKRLNWEAETGQVVYRGRPSHRGGLAGMSSSFSPASLTTFRSRHSREVRYWGFYATQSR